VVTRLLIAVALIALASRASAGQTADAARFERVAGVTADAAERFFQRLRAAVGLNDRPGACALIAYPLPLPDGSLTSASDCAARYDAVFTVEVRKAIGKQMAEELFVNERGVMVGVGEVWFAGRCATPPCGPADLRVIAINRDAADLVPPRSKVLLACRASGQLAHVAADGSGGAEMRLWRSGRSADTPTLVLPKAVTSSRDDRCGARTWTFADGATRYALSNLSCDAHLSPPPMGAVGQLVVKREGMDDVQLWCVE
jgi:hypothetical protein